MPFHEEAPCTTCNGQGVIEIDDLTSALCHCTRTRLMRAHLGPEIASAKKRKDTPLYERGPTPSDPPIIDRTRENLFIKGHWPDLIAHFRYALICKGLMFRFQVITDERIKTVYVGADSFEKRAREERDQIKKTYNSLQDIVCEHDLTIIRLGFLGHKNRSMPGALKEALMLREVQRKPTWIIEDPKNPFDLNHKAYSDEVAEYINSNYAIMDLVEDRPPSELRGVDLQQPRTETFKSEEPFDVSAMPSVEPDDIDSLMGDGSAKKSWTPKKSRFNKSRGGGPV